MLVFMSGKEQTIVDLVGNLYSTHNLVLDCSAITISERQVISLLQKHIAQGLLAWPNQYCLTS